MSDSRAIELLKQANQLFEGRDSLLSLWQTIAENFYVQRADFTRTRNIGDELAEGLLSSYPLLAHRELTGVLSSMLRRDEWFKVTKQGGDNISNMGQRWLDRATEIQRNAMYQREAAFMRATKEGDGDFAAFGQAVLSVEMRRDRSGLLYRNWHLRDCAWADQDDMSIGQFVRKWEPYAGELVRMFGDKVSTKTREIADRNAYTRVKCMHIVTPSHMVNDSKFDEFPFVSTYIECGEQTVLEEIGLFNKIYCVPRWQTIAGSQYAYSPATVAALPDARLLQAMTNTLLEAGEKFTNPPMLAVEGMLRGDLQIFAGGVTYIDADYDERTGDVLRPLNQNSSGMPIGFEMAADIRNQLSEAFYLNKLTLPDARQMTAYEVNERMQEFVRQTLPLFEPMESEYNGQLCDITFDLLMRNGDFGSALDIPRELRGQSIEFEFESPISQAVGKQKGQKFMETAEMLGAAMQVDPGARHEIDVAAAFRDALIGVGVDAEWLRPEEQAAQMRMQEQMQQAAMMAMQAEGVEQ